MLHVVSGEKKLLTTSACINAFINVNIIEMNYCFKFFMVVFNIAFLFFNCKPPRVTAMRWEVIYTASPHLVTIEPKFLLSVFPIL